jgi:hypothetical protein
VLHKEINKLRNSSHVYNYVKSCSPSRLQEAFVTGRHKQRAEIPQNVDFYALFTLILRHLASTLAGEQITHKREIYLALVSVIYQMFLKSEG